MFAKVGDAALWRTSCGRVEGPFFHVTGRQPFPQDLLIHRDIGFQPRMADPVKARLNVPFENPLGRMPSRQDDKALSNGIGNRTLGPKAVSISVRLRFRHRLKCQQVQCLHGPIAHARNAERPLFAVLLGDIEATQRQGTITPSLQ
jgi:hypothetical protein